MASLTVNETDISPPQHQGYLLRKTLLTQCQQAPRKLCLIQAPPGYGKTVLLSQLYGVQKQTAVWLNLRESDNDPVGFLQKLGSCLTRLTPDNPGKANSHHLNGFTPPSLTPWVHSLIDEVNAYEHFSFFINDIDFVTSASVLDIISTIIQYSGASVRFYIATSASARFSYSHLLLENQVAYIHQESLRFSAAETKQVFQLKNKRVPHDNLLQKLSDLTEGWPTAIYFAALNLSNDNALEDFITDLAQGQIAFDRYFIEKIYERQSQGIRSLMLKLSMLDCFNAELCHLLSENADDGKKLASLIQDHTFISAIDSEAHWFRFHQMFCVFLRKRCLLELTVHEQQDSQLRAAHWLKQAGKDEEAINIALQANALSQAALWIEDALPTVVVRYGKNATYYRWFKRLPETIVRQFPRIRLAYILSLSIERQFLAAAEQIALLHKYREDYSPDINKEINRTIALAFCGTKALKDEADSVEPEVTQWISTWNDISHYKNSNDYHYELGFAWWVKGYCAKCRSAFALAQNALNQAINHFQAYGSHWGQAWVRAILAVNYAKQGFHYEALKEALEAYQQARENLGEKSHPGFGLSVLIAAIHYETDDLDIAEKYQRDALEYLKEQSATDLLVAAFETRARLLIHKGAREEGFGFLKDGIKWAENQSLPRLQLRLVDELVVWLLRHRRATEAERYASHYDLIQRDANDFNLEQNDHKTTARSRVFLLLERGQYHDAITMLEGLLERSTTLKHLRVTAEWYKLSAIAHDLANEPEKSRTALIHALEIAALQNYFRLFIDDYSALARPLQAIAAQAGKKPYGAFLSQLMNKLKRDTQSLASIEILTGKEIEIMRFLEGGLANKAIAEKLFVSEGTLKWHLHNIYSKLLVKNRTQALAAARQQGYL